MHFTADTGAKSQLGTICTQHITKVTNCLCELTTVPKQRATKVLCLAIPNISNQGVVFN